jgi:hypothetical protein
MTASNATPLRSQQSQAGDDPLVYAVELWTEDRAALDQILARASSATLARAIFAAAKEEHPARHLVLRYGVNVIDQT